MKNKIPRQVTIFLVIVVLFSCEKFTLPESEITDKDKGLIDTATVVIQDGEDTEETDTSSKDETIPEAIRIDSVIRLDFGINVCVKGYIVGSCTKTINNAYFSIPTSYSQCILLADNPNEQDKNHILAVCLTEKKSLRKVLNLVDNPDHFHQAIEIEGTTAKYLNTSGFKKLTGYWFLNNIDTITTYH